MKVKYKITMLLLFFMTMSCSSVDSTQNLEDGVESGTHDVSQNNYQVYIDNFAANYDPIEGAYYPIDNTHAFYVDADTQVITRVTELDGVVESLYLELYNGNATGTQIKKILTKPNTDTIITSDYTANFHLVLEMVNGTIVNKIIEIQIKDEKLYLDKVAIGLKRKEINPSWLENFTKIIADKNLFRTYTNTFSGPITIGYGYTSEDGKTYINDPYLYPYTIAEMPNKNTAIYTNELKEQITFDIYRNAQENNNIYLNRNWHGNSVHKGIFLTPR